MPNQLSIITNNPRLRRNQIAELNARQSLLPRIIAGQQRAEDLKREDNLRRIQIDQFNRQHKLAKKGRRAADRAGEVGMGLEAGKLGLTMSGKYGSKTFGQVQNDIKSLFGFGGGKTSTFTPGSGNFFQNLSVGSTLGSGLAGFGASRLVGGKNKLKKAAVGVGAGALLGMLSGGGGGGSIFGGGLAGGLGSLF